MAIKVIIFDLDGTLVDSSVDICHAINYALKDSKVPFVTVPETISLIGEGITRLFEKIIDMHDLRKDKALLINRFLEFYSAHLIDNTTIYPGVVETLTALGGYRKAVISNKREDLSARALEMLGLRGYFDFIVGSDTTPERKPSPVPINYVLSRLNIGREDAIIVGDSTFDIDAGRAAGIGTIAVTYGYRPADMLRGADFMVGSMPDILEIVRGVEELRSSRAAE
ncbi:MAG TPA: HAD-IA family hydrolase [Dissulfurispiraceae bacterium]|nr:HAD-IA family hydrolase [Dissulfurispiraceae bacterium]